MSQASVLTLEKTRLRFIEPMLPTLVQDPPTGDRWLHEIKHDGYRTQLQLNGGERLAFTRNGFDWSDRYAPILEDARRLKCRSAIIDGEVIVQDAQGRADFVRCPSRSTVSPIGFSSTPLMCCTSMEPISVTSR